MLACLLALFPSFGTVFLRSCALACLPACLPACLLNFLIASLLFGLSSTQVRGDDISGFDKLGISAGAELAVPFKDKWSVALGILYVNKGSRNRPNTKDGDFNVQGYQAGMTLVGEEEGVFVGYQNRPVTAFEAVAIAMN